MSDRQPYSRVYWSIRKDPKFRDIYGDDHHLAAWLRLLIAADATWPAPADVPALARKASVKALADCGLIDLQHNGMFTIHGLDAERGRRREAASRGASGTQVVPKWEADGSSRAGEAELRRDETSRAAPTPARRNGLEPIGTVLPRVDLDVDDAFGVSEGEARVFSFIARHGASIRPDQGLGMRLLGLMERRGVEEVLRQAGVMAKASEKLSDRQWVFGLEGALETVPSAKDARVADAEEEARKRSERIQREMAARRKERERWVAS